MNKPIPNSHGLYDRLNALRYLVTSFEGNTNEWTEAGMYHSMVKVLEAKGGEYFDKEYLDRLLEEAENY